MEIIKDDYDDGIVNSTVTDVIANISNSTYSPSSSSVYNTSGIFRSNLNTKTDNEADRSKNLISLIVFTTFFTVLCLGTMFLVVRRYICRNDTHKYDGVNPNIEIDRDITNSRERIIRDL